jgi:hypothetical protein
VLRDLSLYAPTAMHWGAAGQDTPPNAAPSAWALSAFPGSGASGRCRLCKPD